jgi:hypothetical protein
MRYGWIWLVAMGCAEFGASVPVADPGLREEDGADDRAGLDACADLLVRCVDLGVSDDTAIRAFDECLRVNVRDGEVPDRGDEERQDEERQDEERDGDGDRGDEERDGDGGDEGDPERPA